MCQGISEELWLGRMLEELEIQNSKSMTLLCENKVVIKISKNQVHHDRTKHVDIDRHFINEKIEEGRLQLTYVPTSYQTTNILTKALPRNNFESLKTKLGMIDIHNPA